MRSLARLFSSSRRAPPKAASKPYLSSACFRLSVFITWVCSDEPESNGIDAALHAVLVDMHDQIQSEPLGRLVAELDHLPEFPGRIDMHQRERRLGGIEGLHRQMQHHAEVLADGIEHHRIAEFGRHLAHDVDDLGFQPPQMGRAATIHRLFSGI